MCLAVPGQIVETEGEGLTRTGRVRFGAVIKQASLAFLPEAREGDYVLVHAGVALGLLNEEEALRVFEYLEQIDEVHG